MKHLQFFIGTLLLSNSLIIVGAQALDPALYELTPLEKQCFKWFTTTAKLFPPIIETLSAEDQQVFNQGIKYTESPELVIRSRRNYVSAHMQQAASVNLKFEHDEETLQSAVLKSAIALHTKNIKITDELSARRFVYMQLKPEEQTALRQAKNPQRPQEALDVAQKWSELVAAKCAEYKFIEDTDEAKKQKAQALYNDQITILEKELPKMNIALQTIIPAEQMKQATD